MCWYPYTQSGRNYKLKDLRYKPIEELNKRYFQLLEMAKYQTPISNGKDKGKYRYTNKTALAEKYKRVMLEKDYKPHVDGAKMIAKFIVVKDKSEIIPVDWEHDYSRNILETLVIQRKLSDKEYEDFLAGKTRLVKR